MMNGVLGGCYQCYAGVKHTHEPMMPHAERQWLRLTEGQRLLARWLEWSEAWGDRDMLQALQAETRQALNGGHE